jgi:hypothetical protein
VEQLRGDIDSGRTGDKVRVSDPAAAPLGADDEAAGTPPAPGVVARERAQPAPRPGPEPAQGRGGSWLLPAVIIAVVVIVAGLLLVTG